MTSVAAAMPCADEDLGRGAVEPAHLVDRGVEVGPGRVLPCREPETRTPVPSRLVSSRRSPGRAPPLRSSRSGWAAPMTASPYFGSGSRIVWPPASVPPASRTLDEAPSKIAASTSRGRSSGNAAIDSANRTRPPIAKTSRQRVRRGDLPERPRVVDERREEVERADDREVVADPVGGGVVGRVAGRRSAPRRALRRPRRRDRAARRPAGRPRASRRSRRSRSASVRRSGFAGARRAWSPSDDRVGSPPARRAGPARYHRAGSGRVPVGPLVFKTSGAALGAARWVRLPRAPATEAPMSIQADRAPAPAQRRARARRASAPRLAMAARCRRRSRRGRPRRRRRRSGRAWRPGEAARDRRRPGRRAWSRGSTASPSSTRPDRRSSMRPA